MSSKYWFYIKDGKEHGPVTEDELLQLFFNHTLAPDTLVKSFMTNWTTAKNSALFKADTLSVSGSAPHINIFKKAENKTLTPDDALSETSGSKLKNIKAILAVIILLIILGMIMYLIITW